MSNKDFFIAHGEKLALVVLVGLSAWTAYETFNNPAVNPGTTEADINDKILAIAKSRATQAAPDLKTPPNYVAALKSRLDRNLPVQPSIAWLTGQPDVGPVVGGTVPIYIYELLQPKVTVKDLVGTVELTCVMPESVRTEGRMVDLPSKVWRAKDSENRAERVGLLVEYSIGNQNGTYKPLVTSEIKDGFVRCKDDLKDEVKIKFPADIAWETYYFRVRLVARVTAYPLGKADGETALQTVLVNVGRWSGPDPVWTEIDKVRKGELADRFAKPHDKTFSELELKPGESCFVSKETACSVAVTSATRFTYERSYLPDATNEDIVGATVLITKLLPPLPGPMTQGKWLLAPVVFKVEKDKPVGGKVEVLDPRRNDKNKIPIDLSTPFVFGGIKKNLKRILYYQIKTKARASGGGQRDLEIVPKEVETEAAEFVNPSTKQSRVFSKMIRIQKQVGLIITPDFPGLVYDEEEEFRKNPAEFKQRDLVPPLPLIHEPGVANGPLEEYRKRTGDESQTDTKYIEMPDGRVYFWDPLNKAMKTFIIPGSEADLAARAQKPRPAAAPGTAAPGAAAAPGAPRTPTPATPKK